MNTEKLDFWLKNGLNVLFKGRHGTGKTTVVCDAFERNDLKHWKYFSAATMDPWVDFVGVPKERINGDGEPYLDLVLPKEFRDDLVEAIFFDEFNRAPRKVRNAVMELIQFRSINGRKFKNLKVVWAAINPDDNEDTYDVERLDPAQEDRFHVHVEMPYEPNKEYFVKKYGEKCGQAACAWWREIGEEVQKAVSPRRLDYAIQLFFLGGDIRDALPRGANVTTLLKNLENGPVTIKLEQMFNSQNVEEATKFLKVENNYSASIIHIVKDEKWIRFFTPCMPKEKIAALISSDETVRKIVIDDLDQHDIYNAVISSVFTAESDKELIKNIRSLSYKALGTKPVASFSSGKKSKGFDSILDQLMGELAEDKKSTTQARKQAWKRICENIPDDLNTALAEKTMDVVELIAKQSNPETLLKLENVMGVVNACVRAQVGNITEYKQWQAKYVVRYQDIKHRIIASPILGKQFCLRPAQDTKA